MAGYAAPNISPEVLFVSEKQRHSCEWLKSSCGQAPLSPAVALVP